MADRAPFNPATFAPATFALAEYDRRREKLIIALGQRPCRLDPAHAVHQQRCWLAIAIMAGADPADAAPELEFQRRQWPDAPATARALAADHCAPRAAWAAELTRATAVALSRNEARSRHLLALRAHLGVTDPIPLIQLKTTEPVLSLPKEKAA